jgi:hypothetical protein
MKISVQACDVCGDYSVPLRSLNVTVDGNRIASLDLCEEHLRPIMSVVSGVRERAKAMTPHAGRSAAARRRQRNPTVRSTKIATMEEIEAAKEARRAAETASNPWPSEPDIPSPGPCA